MANSKSNFKTINGKTYLVDQYDQPVVYTTRFSAMLKFQSLKSLGMDIEIAPTTEFGTFYHIIQREQSSLTTTHI